MTQRWLALAAFLLVPLSGLAQDATRNGGAPAPEGAADPATPAEVGAQLERVYQTCQLEDTGHIRIVDRDRWRHIDVAGVRGRCSPRLDGILPTPPSGGEIRYELEIVGGRVRFVGMRTQNTPAPPRSYPRMDTGTPRTDAENDALDARVLACWSRRDPPCVRRLLEHARPQTDRQFWWLTNSLSLVGEREQACAVSAEHRRRFPASRLRDASRDEICR